MSHRPDFILFGVGNYNTLGVLHQLAAIGVDPLIISVGDPKDRQRGNIIGYSKYARRIKVVESELSGLEWILSHQESFSVGTIIYPTSDTVELLLDRHYDALSHWFRYPNAGGQNLVARLMDKHSQNDLAKAAGLRILESQYSNSPSFSFANVVYPCMVKPLNSTTGSKCDMRICMNKEELLDALQGGKCTRDFIVQQYIANEADFLFLGIAFENGEVWIPAVVIKPGVSPTGEYTHALVSTDVKRYLPEIEHVKAFVIGLGYRGPFSIEFGLEKGKKYFFEINLRNDGTSHYPMKAGVNIAATFYNSLLYGKPCQDDMNIITNCEYEMIDECGDLRRVLRREITLPSWLRSFVRAGSYRFYHQGDRGLILPLIQMFLSRSLGKLGRMFQ